MSSKRRKYPQMHDGIVKVQDYFEGLNLPIHLMRTSAPNNYSHPMHKHEFTEMSIVASGHAIHRTTDGTFPIQTGDVFIIPCGKSHGYSQAESFSLINILLLEKRLAIPMLDFSLSPFADFFLRKDQTCQTILTLSPESLAKIKKLALQIESEDIKQEACYRFKSLALFMLILAELGSTDIPDYEPEKKTYYAMPEAQKYLEQNYARKISFPQLARHSSMSLRNFYRAFKRSIGMTPLQFLLNIRLRHAQELLAGSSMGLEEIARRCGFTERQQLYYHFSHFFGESPLDYRMKEQTH